MRNLTSAAATGRLKPDGTNNNIAAGTGDTLTSNSLDTLGFAAIRFIIALGAITATGVLTPQVKYSDDNATFVNVTGATVVPADTDDGKILIIDIYRPKKRYVELVCTRATANIVIDSITWEMYLPDNEPVTQDATVAQSVVILNAP